MSLAAFLHPLVQPAPVPAPISAPVPAGVVPRCGAVDWITGAVCTGVVGHFTNDHASADQDFEIRWPRA